MNVQIDDAPKNMLLQQLRPDDFDLLRQDLRPYSHPTGKMLYVSGDEVETVYFPCGSTMVSFLAETEGGSSIETLMVGCEGAVGGIVSRGRLPAYTSILVQFSGDFLALPVSKLELAKASSSALSDLFARYADCMLAQMFQASACSAAHTIEQRVAKWIVAVMERTDSTTIPVTQERLASMLGVGRSYVSRVIGTLKKQNVVTVHRGALVVLDVPGLAKKSCNCNETVQHHFDHVLAGIYAQEASIAQ